MNPERWPQIHLLVEGALEQSEALRTAFVDSACGADLELRKEVLSLIAACERSPDIPAPPTEWLGVLAEPESPRFAAGEHIAARYRIGRLLGRGGMGEVYEAWDEELSIPVALKALHLPGSTDDAHRRLKLEGILARSVWHPNVCRFYDLGRHDAGGEAIWFLTMELLSGETLSKRLHDRGRLAPDRAQRVAEQIAAGLGAAHRAGVVHRDFKTGNIMLVTRDGGEQAVVTDFGIARAASPRTAQDGEKETGFLMGTPAYMAPEQVLGEEVGPVVDIYALGIVLYEMVTGALPFTGDSPFEVARRRLQVDPPSPRHVVPDLDDRWEAVILRCLAQDPRRRFRRAEDVVEALDGRMPIETAESLDLTIPVRHSLPAERDPFLGRELESEDLERYLTGDRRLVTLVGAGGMGKTRLAVHYGWRKLGDWPGGVWFCDLTEARSPDGIASAVAGSLGLQLGRGNPIEQLGHAIAGRGRCLMILDNFEQLVDHAPATVGPWLARAGKARFLVTSRERLGLAGEQVQQVGPLATETGRALFVARAQRLRPGLQLAGAEAEAVREIVRLVDGMPLAIELAGARMRVMSASQILAQMQKRFSLLTGGDSARHETLVMTIDGSWELLKPWERSAWAQCTVFEGGFTLEAAENVIDLGTWPEAPLIVDVVQSLMDKSLLQKRAPARETSEGLPEARFGMYVSLQEYARLRLREDPSLANDRMAEERHGHWYARFGTSEALETLRQQGGSKRGGPLDRELDNLISACRRALERGDHGTDVAAYGASWAVLAWRGPFGVGVDLGRQILHQSGLGRTEEAHVLATLGLAEWCSGMVEESRAHQESGLAIARELSDRHLEARFRGNLGVNEAHRGRAAEGADHLEMAIEVARELGDRILESNTLNSLSIVRRAQGRMGEARTCAELALEVARALGDRQLEGNALNTLGIALHVQGCSEEARVHYEAADAAYREIGYRRYEAATQHNLGMLAYNQGRMNEALAHLEAALLINRETGSRYSECSVLIDLGSLYQALGRIDEAREHLEAARVIEGELGSQRLKGNLHGALGRFQQDHGEVAIARAQYDSALAIHRALGDRRSEGIILANLASLHHRQGEVEATKEALASGEPLLRELDARLELGQLLCVRAELEHGSGNVEAALATFVEAEELATGLGSGPDSDLGRMIAKLRRMLATNEGITSP
jgi:serine/threonine protein kinase/tetratricopeptide (TPR) repeat protein